MDIQASGSLERARYYGAAQNLSFREKIQLMNKDRPLKSRATSPVTFNKYTPYIFMIELLGVWYVGVGYAIPYLYGGYGLWMSTCVQAFCNFMGLQIVMNWLCMVNVDSYYEPDVMDIPQEMRTMKPPEPQHKKDPHKTGETTQIPQEEKTTRSYWTWNFCQRCQRMKPPRCHHCVLCQRCVLKRDHHCFFARQCIGFRNFRFFAVLIFWCTVGTTFAFLHALPFFYIEVFRPSNYVDILFPLTIFRWVLGYTEWHLVFIVPGMWTLAVFVIYSWSLSAGIWELIFNGKTMFEHENNIRIRDTRTLTEKLHAVFGYYWIINFFVPQYKFLPLEEPIYWRTIRLLE